MTDAANARARDVDAQRPPLATVAPREWHHTRSILESITDAFYAIGDDWRLIYVNPAGARLVRLAADQCVGRSLWEQFPDLLGTRFEEEYRRAMRHRAACEFEDYYGPLGAWLRIHVYPWLDGIAVQVQDITQRRQDEAARSRLMSIVEATTDVVCTVSLDGSITYLNEAGRRLSGLSELGTLPELSLDAIFPRWARIVMTTVAIPAALRDGVWRGEGALRRADGSEVPVSQVVLAHRSAGDVEYLSLVIRERGEQSRTEALARAAETERLARIVDLQQSVATASLDADEVIQSVLDRAQALTGAEGVGLVMREGCDMQLRGTTGGGPVHGGVQVADDEPSLISQCLTTGRVLRCDDTETDPRVHRRSSRASGARSLLYVPVHGGDEVIGAIGVLSHRPDAFGERDEQSLTLVAGLLSAVIARAVAFETNQKLLAERTVALAALRESEMRYRSVTEQVCEVIFETDPAGRLTFLTPAWETITGHAIAESLGRVYLAFIHEEDRDATREELDPIVRGDRAHGSHSMRCRTRDGGVRWLELRAGPRLNAAGEIVGTMGTFNDISDRVIAEQMLRTQALTFASIHDAVVVTDAIGHIVDWNPAAEGIFGYGRDEVIGQIATLLRASVSAAADVEIEQTLARGERWIGEIRARHKDGSERVCETVVVPRVDKSGALVGTIAVSRDVTASRLLEQQLRQAQKLEAIGQLAAGIAHEINTPTQYVGDNVRFIEQAFGDVLDLIAVQQRLAETCRAHGIHDDLVAAVDDVAARADMDYLAAELPLAVTQSLDGIERISEIVRGMKAFSHPGTGALTATDLNHQLESTITVSRNEWKYVAEVVRDLDPTLPPVWCRVGEINQVLLNVIVNAGQAIAEQRGGARQKGRITVTSRRDGAWAEIRIADTGSGIPIEARSRVFDPFFTTKEVGRGTGQGLAIAHRVIEAHGGTMSFETEVGVGTTFTIRLPFAGEAGVTHPAEAA